MNTLEQTPPDEPHAPDLDEGLAHLRRIVLQAESMASQVALGARLNMDITIRIDKDGAELDVKRTIRPK